MFQWQPSSSDANFCPVEGGDYYDQPNHKTIKVHLLLLRGDHSCNVFKSNTYSLMIYFGPTANIAVKILLLFSMQK